MQVEITDKPLTEVEAEVHCLLLFDGQELPEWLRDAIGAADLKTAYRQLTMLRPEEGIERVLVVGLGKASEYEPERARVAAAMAISVAERYDGRAIAWSLEGSVENEQTAAALVEGTILGSYSFDRYKGADEDENGEAARLERLTLITGADVEGAIREAHVAAEAANRARELQDLPSNELTPTRLAERAQEIAESHQACSIEVLGREEMSERGMGGLIGVSKGSAEEPRLIVLRYSGGGAGRPLAFVGKAVTFDSGGISIKPASSMHEMKMDMSGGAAVLEAVDAIATLGLPIDLLALIPSVENMPSGTALKPGDIIAQHNGKSVEIINTDAEGRLILADALSYAVELGAERIVDLATLTGAVVTALGSTYAGLISNDEALAAEVAAAGEEVGELAWRLPLHDEYKDLTKGTITDLVNASDKRKASTIYAASFLEEFVDGRPWAHLDIAGTAWDVGREYVGKGATGYGVRLLVRLAHRLSSD